MKRLLVALAIFTSTGLYAADWPREIQSPEGTITIYQPQVDSFKQNQLSARTAVSIIRTGSSEPVFGAIWIDCRVLTDRPSRTVRLEDVKVKEIKFPKGTTEETAAISRTLEEEMPRADITFSLDELLESLDTAKKENENAEQLDVLPPKVIVLNRPAVLVQIDGAPILEQIEGTPLKRVVNTPFFMVNDPSQRKFYLHGGTNWYSASDVMGPWQPGMTPPQSVITVYEQSKSDDGSTGDSQATETQATTGKIPDIVVSTEPAELIATDGSLKLSPIRGTGLLFASNTPSKLFLEIKTQDYYILISGRWYRSKSVEGPWSYIASERLPVDFANIPPGSDRDDVLASVAGTVPANEAVLDAQIPQTAEVDRSQTTSQVEYDGQPQFDPIENTGMSYAVNTSSPVILVGGRYFNCDRGIWFEGGSAYGPWSVCVNVPPAIYTIPPRCPMYYVRYVRVYSYTPAFAYVGYTSGYTGCYVFGNTVVYGTGYHYRPWFHRFYYPRPLTWGFGVHYDPWTGWSIGMSTGWWRPAGWFAYNWRGMHPGWWGPVGYRPAYRPVIGPVYRSGYHPIYRPTVAGNGSRGIGSTRGATLYDHWNDGVRRPVAGSARRSAPVRSGSDIRGDRSVVRPTAKPESRPELGGNASRANRRVTRPSTKENNIYASPNGNILRRTPGGWQQREQNTWKNTKTNSSNAGMDREYKARQRGAERSAGIRSAKPERSAPAKTPKETRPRDKKERR